MSILAIGLPEPTTVLLLGTGLLGLVEFTMKSNKQGNLRDQMTRQGQK